MAVLPAITESLRSAILDYRMLLDRGYPVQASVKLVGDRYRLERADRIILFRGILDGQASASIRARIIEALPAGAAIAVDGYNVLFTIANYLKGHPLFVGTDGLLRDAGGAHGRFAGFSKFFEAAAIMVGHLADLHPAAVTVYLDSPVSGSGDHATAIRTACALKGLQAEVSVVQSADPFVRDFIGGASATADSAVAATARSPVFDLARDTLSARFGARFQDLGLLLRAE